MTGLTVPLALAAGVVSFASPCFLPVVPVFVSALVAPATEASPWSRGRAVLPALAFVAGFTVVFVAMWAAVGIVGYAVGDYRPLARTVGGALLFVMGLHVAGLLRVPLLDYEFSLTRRSTLRHIGNRASATRGEHTAYPAFGMPRAALAGIAFAAAWTPCIGPILGGVIGLASVGDSLGEGVALLLAYAVGLGIPFVLVAAGASRITRHLEWFRRRRVGVSLASGLGLGLIGFAMIAGLWGTLAGLVPVL